MYDPQDKETFWTAMNRLSIALSIELTDERVAVYWDALCDLAIAAVVYGCQHAARWWRPLPGERFPVPLTLREYARQYHEAQRQQEAAHARAQIPQWSKTPDEIGVQAIRNILQLLDKQTDMARVVQKPMQTSGDDPLRYEPSEPPEEAKARLREQFRILREEEGEAS